MVNRERDDNVYYARLAEQGERYEDMIRYMKEVANVSELLSIWKQIKLLILDLSRSWKILVQHMWCSICDDYEACLAHSKKFEISLSGIIPLSVFHLNSAHVI